MPKCAIFHTVKHGRYSLHINIFFHKYGNHMTRKCKLNMIDSSVQKDHGHNLQLICYFIPICVKNLTLCVTVPLD